MGLSRIVEPECLPVSVAEAKKQVEVSAHLTTHNAHLERLIRAATNQVEQRTDRSLLPQTWMLTLDSFYNHFDRNDETSHPYSYSQSDLISYKEIYLPRPPMVEVESIQYYDTHNELQTLETDRYYVSTNSHPGRITPAYSESWPYTLYRMEAVQIRYRSGYETVGKVPDDFKQAILIAVDHWFDPDKPMSGPESMALPGAAMSLIDSLHSGMKYGAYGVTD